MSISLAVFELFTKNGRGEGNIYPPPSAARVNGKLNPAAAGPPRHPPAAGGGGIKLPPLYFCDDIVATRCDREAKLCTHLPEYLVEVVS